jgi:hypothetical protein
MSNTISSTGAEGQYKSTDGGNTHSLELSKMAIIARGLFEYRNMFQLTERGLNDQSIIANLLEKEGATILDLPGSTSTIGRQLRNMAMRANSDLKVYSADLAYFSSIQEIYDIACKTAKDALNPIIEKGNSWQGHDWASEAFKSATPSEWLSYRLATYKAWLEDISNPQIKEFYRPASFPDLNELKDLKFDLILSSNCLFAYEKVLVPNGNEQDVFNFHLQSILNMGSLLKEGGEIRIYPISSGVNPVYSKLQELISEVELNGYKVQLLDVPEPPNTKSWDKLLSVKK